jgi:hypothetical protein
MNVRTPNKIAVMPAATERTTGRCRKREKNPIRYREQRHKIWHSRSGKVAALCGPQDPQAHPVFPDNAVDLLDFASSTPRAISRVIYIFSKCHLVPSLRVIGAAGDIVPFVDPDRAVHPDRCTFVRFGTYPYSSFLDVGFI